MASDPTAEPAEPEAAPAPEPEPPAEPAPAPAETASADHVVLRSELDKAIALLRRPPTAEAVRFKIQTKPKDAQGSALVVCYIDSRFCSDRLNVVAPGLWSDSYLETPHKPRGEEVAAVLCRVKLTVPLNDGGTAEVVHADVGTSAGTASDKDMKGLYSDAFKRACVKFGIGACLYAAPKLYIDASKLGGSLDKPRLTPANEQECRRKFAAWLPTAEEVYGAALSHGDVAGAQGDVDAEGDESAGPASGLPYGPSAAGELTAKLGSALTYLLGDDVETAGGLHTKLVERCDGYMPAAVAVAIGLVAGAVKARDEEQAAQEAHAELDAAADQAAQEGGDPAVDTTTEGSTTT